MAIEALSGVAYSSCLHVSVQCHSRWAKDAPPPSRMSVSLLYPAVTGKLTSATGAELGRGKNDKAVSPSTIGELTIGAGR